MVVWEIQLRKSFLEIRLTLKNMLVWMIPSEKVAHPMN